MRNFKTFDKEYVKLVVEPFLPGGAEHITPIRYQALTPDMFAFLFRTTGKDRDYFFVSLEFDYVQDIHDVAQIIQDWAGSEILQFATPAGKEASNELTLADVIAPTAEPYQAVLASVEMPKNLGYWSEHIVLRPGDSLRKSLADFSDEHFESVQKFVGEHSKPKTEKPTKNTTQYSIAVYKNSHDALEFFYS